jgi:hypothetical protein
MILNILILYLMMAKYYTYTDVLYVVLNNYNYAHTSSI